MAGSTEKESRQGAKRRKKKRKTHCLRLDDAKSIAPERMSLRKRGKK